MESKAWFFSVGFIALETGIGMWSCPLAFVIGGSVLMLVGLLMAIGQKGGE